MSTKGIYTALSGAMAQTNKLDTIANNIANASTTGFKRDQQVFKEYLTAAEKVPDVIQVPKVPASVESFYDMQAADRGYVDASGTYTDHSQGGLKATGNPLDVALDGKGFMEIMTPEGVRYTRNGSFTISTDGKIVTKEGFPVLKQGLGQSPEQRFLTIQPGEGIVVTSQGEVFQGENSLGKLSCVNVNNADALQKTGRGLYATKENLSPVFSEATETQFQQGFVETSNVNIVREMTDMIQTTRAFESAQKAIKAYDQMEEKLVNEVPKLG